MKTMKTTVVAVLVALTMGSCNNASPKMDEKPASAESEAQVGVKIAYVEVDSLMTQYQFAKDFTAVLEKKGNNARNTLQQKGNALQTAANNFQQKLENNGFTSRDQAANAQASLQRQQQNLQELQARLASELDDLTAKYNTALRDSLNHFLEAYNKDKQYDLILSKAGDNILMANAKFNITKDVINGLNKRYKGGVKE